VSAAAALLAEAHAAGVWVRLTGAAVKVTDTAPPDLLERLRAAKPELVAILKGDRCVDCGTALAWPRPAGVVFNDGTAACLPCYEARPQPEPRPLPTTIANCARCRKVRALDADGLCVGCAKEPPF
jgi:hypothetical protein